MEDREHIEMDIADTIMERPVGFNIGSWHFFIYPPTLGKTHLLARLFKELNANDKIIAVNPYMESFRLCSEKRDIVCRILSYYTFNQKKDIFNNTKIDSRANLFNDSLDNEELATLFALIFSSDNTDEYIKYFGIDKEKSERKRIAEVKKDNNSITFGGNSTYGTLIDFACQRYGWTMDYVVWGISYANLKMLMADTITTIHLNEDEMKQLHIFDNVEYINADDPKNKELIREILYE